MTSPSADEADRTPSRPMLLAVIDAGRHGDTAAALGKITTLLPTLAGEKDGELLLIGLWGRAELLWRADPSSREVAAACDLLEQAAQERRAPVWLAIARALRTTACLDAGDIAACVADLTGIDLDQLSDGLDSVGGSQFLDLLATAYSRLHLHDRVDGVRARAELSLAARRPLDRAVHWAHRATELAVRALEPLTAGADEPDPRLLQQAAQFADQLSTVPPDLVPDRLRRGADAVRALEASFRGRPAEALRLLGEDGFRPPTDLPGLERRLAMIAAMHAQVLIGAVDTARLMDHAGDAPLPSLPYLVLDVCRAVERLRLENHNDGDPVPALRRINDLLVRLGITSLELVGETARQALEQQALRVENRTDALTGVGNRRALDEELRNLLRFSPLPMSLLLVDVDKFKTINDRYTHVVGDEVLRRIAKVLSRQLRSGDHLVRYGGDEFVVLLPHTADTEAEAVATRMIEEIRTLRWGKLVPGLTVRITTGCGTLWSLSHRRPDDNAEYLFRIADEQLLEAKRRRADDSAPPAATATHTPATTATHTPATTATHTPATTATHASATTATPAGGTTPPSPLAGRPALEIGSLAGLLGEAPAAHSPLTGGITLPLTGSLPLYQALLADPPRVDPHLGLLPPRGTTPLTASDSFTRSAPGPAQGLESATRANPEANQTRANPEANHRAENERPTTAAEPPQVRLRRRPNVIDLRSVEKRRSPFG